MPMLDATIPRDALDPAVEGDLVNRLTDLLLLHEGADPSNERARALAWVWVHRPDEVYVGGAAVGRPRYRLAAHVPEGQYSDERRTAMVADATRAVLDAEAAMGRSPDPKCVWVFTSEVPERTAGIGGRIVGLGDIVGIVKGDADAGHAYAERVFADRRAAARVTPDPAG